MPKRLAITTVALLMACMTPLRAADATVVPAPLAQPKRLQVPSAVMKRDIPASVTLPKGYAQSGLSYPVIYLLHGAGDDEMVWTARTPVQELADTYGIIVVTPSTGTSWFFDSPIDKKFQFETFTASELVKFVDANYRTVPRREGRALAGNSMGGHGAMFLGIRHTDTFSAAAPMSGGMDIRAGSFPNNWNLKDRLGSIESNRARWDELTVMNQIEHLKSGDLAISIDCGTSDFFLEVNRQLHAKLTTRGIAHDYAEFPGEHNWDYWPGSLRRQMAFLDRHFRKTGTSIFAKPAPRSP
jgi:S-formylglutathione hydrolase FrmB